VPDRAPAGAEAGSRRARPHPLLGDAALRTALALPISRRALTRNLLDTLGRMSLGPVTRARATADTARRAASYDTAKARRHFNALR
jgi:ABC-type oligopeptide transport system substrate-binding subunit